MLTLRNLSETCVYGRVHIFSSDGKYNQTRVFETSPMWTDDLNPEYLDCPIVSISTDHVGAIQIQVDPS